jgi:hypothetical protein
MKHGPDRLRLSRKDTSRSWQRRLAVSRIILLLMGVLMLTMPVTERLWTSDQFICTGQYFELSLMGVLLFCGMVVLMAEQVIVSPLFLLMIAHHIKAPPIRKLMNRAYGLMSLIRLMRLMRLIGSLAVDSSRRDTPLGLSISLCATPIRI